MKNIATIIFITILTSCTVNRTQDPLEQKNTIKSFENIETKARNCICPQMWLPVCGKNGKTYSNSCFAKCNEMEFIQGSCEKSIDE